MMTKIISKGALAFSLVGLLLATTRCDEPKAKCAAGRNPFLAVYTATTPTSADCKDKGEVFAISTYNAIGPDLNKPNLDIASIAIEPSTLYDTVDTAKGEGAVDPDATHTQYSLGFFNTAEPDDNAFCYVPTLTTTLQNIPGYPADPDNMITDPVPPTSISYVWTNLKFYVTPQYLGVQMEGDVLKTVDGTACGYHVIGMSPDIACSVPDPNNADNTLPETRLCSPVTIDGFIDPNTGAPFAPVNINPDFPTVCDPDLLQCVLVGSSGPNAHIPILK